MIANVALAMERARADVDIQAAIAYAPSRYGGPYHAAPIRSASPIKRALAGWSARPERPLGAIFGLGCEPGLALGALQVLEPKKTWIFAPRGSDPRFDVEMRRANEHVDEIFDVTTFGYEIVNPTSTRGRVEAILNAVSDDFRMILVPFGPKVFAWLTIATVVFARRTEIGVWAFSSKDQARIVDRDADGHVIWHNFFLAKVS
jgi:hypothetical protein